MGVLRIKKVLCRRGDTVNLGNGADTQKTGQYTEDGEQLAQPLPVFTHTLFDIIERTAKHLTVFIDITILYGKKSLGVFGCHTQKCRKLHPEEGARSAAGNRRCNTDNVSGADGRGKRRTQSAKAGNLTLAVLFVVEHILECQRKLMYLENADAYRQQNSGSQDQNDQRDSPNKIVDLPQNVRKRERRIVRIVDFLTAGQHKGCQKCDQQGYAKQQHAPARRFFSKKSHKKTPPFHFPGEGRVLCISVLLPERLTDLPSAVHLRRSAETQSLSRVRLPRAAN